MLEAIAIWLAISFGQGHLDRWLLTAGGCADLAGASFAGALGETETAGWTRKVFK